MIEIQEEPTQDDRLKPYVEGYGRLTISSDSLRAKELLPWPGSFWLFANQPFSVDHERFPHSCLVGICDQPSHLAWNRDYLEVLSVKFLPHGLRPFVHGPLDQLTNKAVDPQRIWLKERLDQLNARMAEHSSLKEKIMSLENFLLHAFVDFSPVESSIVQFANQLKNNPLVDIDELKQHVPLSSRQFERRFKALTGVTAQTFIRICRFAYARTQLLHGAPDTLTSLGYDSGYFDQAHFSKEFKKLSKSSPKHFPKSYPLFNLIAEKK